MVGCFKKFIPKNKGEKKNHERFEKKVFPQGLMLLHCCSFFFNYQVPEMLLRVARSALSLVALFNEKTVDSVSIWLPIRDKKMRMKVLQYLQKKGRTNINSVKDEPS